MRTGTRELKKMLQRGWRIVRLPGQRSLYNSPLHVPPRHVEIVRVHNGTLTWWWVPLTPMAEALARELVEKAEEDSSSAFCFTCRAVP